MNGKEVFFKAGNIVLEGRLLENKGKKGVVICHPHPQFGGSMDNNVVDALSNTFFDCGFTALKFNFRGVGKSGGNFAGGEGEQEDVRAARDYLESISKDEIFLAGYSFGAWVGAKVIMTDSRFKKSILISPPVGLLDFGFLPEKNEIKLIIYGEKDEFCPLGQLEEIFKDLKKEGRLRKVEGADHFYWGKEDIIKNLIKDYLREKGE
jgi:hypothetical protein